MNDARRRELQLDGDASFTEEEFSAGWHFCHEWDLDPMPADPECEWCGHSVKPLREGGG